MFFVVVLLSCLLAAGSNPASCDENLKTPYIMLDPSSLPPPSQMGEPYISRPVDPTRIRRLPSDLGIPRVTSERQGETESITLTNAALSLRVVIGMSQRAVVQGLQDNFIKQELLSAPSQVFYMRGHDFNSSSDSFRVTGWDAYQYPDYAELEVRFAGEPAAITWKARLYRTRPQLEQEFEMHAGDIVLGQVLNTRESLLPMMPANLFGRGFHNGKPNITDRHRFETVTESEHIAYDPKTQTGLWGFTAETGGQERVARGQFALIQNPSFRTRRSGKLGPFVIQPFSGPVEIGFMQLRRFIQERYAVQGYTPSLYEWNQFWLWQGGPTRVDKKVVTQDRLFDVLPRQVRMGLEEFHFDDGWQWHDGDWRLAEDRIPGGWAALRDFNRRHGLAFHMWMNDGTTDSADAILNLINQSNIGRLFMDRQVTEKTVEAVEKVRARHPGFSTSCHNSTSRSVYWSWGNLHFLSDFNQIYFGEGQFWAWSNILPEAEVEPKDDPLFPQREGAERFFSRHDMYAGDLITRAAAYQAHWVWPFTCVAPPHCGWAWFENRPIAELKDRIYSYLACRFNYQWGFDPAMLRKEVIDLHLGCTAWFKANRSYLTVYQHVLDAPDGKGVDGAGHLRDGRGYVFLFNPSDQEQSVDWRKILWEPELELQTESVTLSDWTGMTDYKAIGTQKLSRPEGSIQIPAQGIKLIGINLNDKEVLTRVRTERRKIGYP